jgi:hypothetical protein
MEAGNGPVGGTYENVSAVVTALEWAGVEFTNGDQPGDGCKNGLQSPRVNQNHRRPSGAKRSGLKFRLAIPTSSEEGERLDA